MSLNMDTVQISIHNFLSGKLSVNQFIRSNDRDVETIQSDPSIAAAQPWLWDTVQKIEGLLLERVYGYIDDPILHARLRELAIMIPSSHPLLIGFHQMEIIETVAPWKSKASLEKDTVRHPSNQFIVYKNVEPNRPRMISRDSDLIDHRVTPAWAAKA